RSAGQSHAGAGRSQGHRSHPHGQAGTGAEHPPLAAAAKGEEGLSVTESQRGVRKTRVSTVVSDKMDKTVVVAVERTVTHPLYKRSMRRTKKFKAHDEENSCRAGDVVRIMETRPLSKEKRWRVVEIIRRAQ